MANRIDGGGAQSLNSSATDSSQETSSSESADKAQSEPATSTTDTDNAASEDVWENADASSYEELMQRDGSASGESEATNISDGEAMSVWEMAGLAGIESADSAAPEPTEESFNISDNAAAGAIATLFGDLHETNPGPNELRREFSNIVHNRNHGVTRESVIELAAHSGELREGLLEIHDDPALADGLIDELQAQVVAFAGEDIARQARPDIQAGIEGMEALNDSSDSRRVFLNALASEADSVDQLTDQLREFGLTESAAENIAEGLDEIRDDPDAAKAFLAGDSGERDVMGGQLRSPYDQIDRRFERELDAIQDGLESLDRSMTSNQIRHDQFLTDPTVAPIRDEVLADMGAVMGPPGEANELGELFNEAIEDSQSSQRNERIGTLAVNIAGGIAATVATAGLGAGAVATGLATSALGTAPDVAVARHDVSRAQGAVGAGFSDQEMIEMAESDRNVAYALSAASLVVGGATSKAEVQTAIGATATMETASSAVGP